VGENRRAGRPGIARPPPLVLERASAAHAVRPERTCSTAIPSACLPPRRVALAAYEAALALAPGNAAALARIGYTYTLIVDWGWPHQNLTSPELRARGVEYSTRAIAADSNSADAWLTRAYVLATDDPYRMRGAVEAFALVLRKGGTSSVRC
jgi:hypothetical protein